MGDSLKLIDVATHSGSGGRGLRESIAREVAKAVPDDLFMHERMHAEQGS